MPVQDTYSLPGLPDPKLLEAIFQFESPFENDCQTNSYELECIDPLGEVTKVLYDPYESVTLSFLEIGPT